MKKCTVKNCGKKYLAKGYCSRHYYLYQQHGVPYSVKENDKRFKHDASHSKLYVVWLSIKQRCFNKNNRNYKRYGGKGIVVCEEWLDFTKFKSWCNKNGYSEKLTIDRIDNEKGYSPDNCRFVNMKVQSNNRSNSLNITRKGKTKTLTQWCEELDINYNKAYYRLTHGYSKEDVLS